MKEGKPPSGRSRFKALLPPRPVRALGLVLGMRLRPVLLLTVVGVVLFTLFRAALLLARFHFIENLSGSQIRQCFLTGLRFDAVPIGYAVFPLAVALALAPRRLFRRQWFRRAITTYAATLLVIAIAVEIAGAAFFLYFGTRLNWLAIVHFGHFREAAVYIWREYPVVLLVAAIAALAVAVRWALRKTLWTGPTPRRLGIAGRAALAAVLVGLCVSACRGGWGQKPLRQSSAYFSPNKLITQLALNNFFSLFHAAKANLSDEDDEWEYYSFPPLAKAVRVTSDMLLQQGDTVLGGAVNPLWRRNDSGRPMRGHNVVVIIMEGMAGGPVGVLGHSPSHTPCFDALCEEGMYFQRMYAVGCRTSRGMVGVLCGYPDVSGASVLKRDLAQGRFLTLPAVFAARGYHTMMIYGGDPDFDNMREFFSKGGISTFIGQREIANRREDIGNWGVPDEMIFARAHQTFRAMGDRKFFAVILTVSNHPPFDVPTGRTEMLPPTSEQARKLNAYRYADWAIGEFFRRASTADYFANTIFVLVSDHGRDLDNERVVDVPGYHIPCVIYAPGNVAPSRVTAVASQVDIAPTVLGLLGGTYEHCFMGRNMLAVGDDDGFAVIHDEDRFAFVRGDLALVAPPRQQSMLFRLSGETMEKVQANGELAWQAEDMNSRLLSYYKMARHLYLTSAYRPPAASATALAAAR